MATEEDANTPIEETETVLIRIGPRPPAYPTPVALAIARAVASCIDIGIEDDHRARRAVTLLARIGVCAPGDTIELGSLELQQRLDERIAELSLIAKGEDPLEIEMFAREVSDAMALNGIDAAIASLAMLALQWRDVARALDLAAPCRKPDVAEVIAAALDAPKDQVEAALERPCLLRRDANTLSDGDTPSDEIRLPRQVERLLNSGNRCVRTVVSMFFRVAAPAEVRLGEFAGFGAPLRIVEALVRGVLERPRKGVNILLHGRPGTGKTQFVRALAESLGARLLEVATEDSDGDALPPMRRVQSLRASLAAMARTPQSLILFDEVEDVFPAGMGIVEIALGGRPQRSDRHKGWLTGILEENERPVFWLCNTIEQIDQAYLRRFDLIVEMIGPGQSAREKLVEKSFAGIQLGDSVRRQLLHDDGLSPGHLRKLSDVLRDLQHEEHHDADASATSILSELRKALRTLPTAVPSKLIRYRPECVRADTDLSQLASALATADGARLCLYGPPGTGKTEWVRHVAEMAGRPLLVRRGSDLLGPFVGMNERFVAQAFEEAARRNAMLLIDEVDSFIGSRANANQQWQAALTNQFLVSLECFGGFCAVTTNLMDSLDPAALRRFDFKVRFDWLDRAQKAMLFGELLEQLGIGDDDPGAKSRVLDLDRLAPGDFANVARQNRVLRIHQDARAVAAALANEVALKPRAAGTGNRIGFV
jgi:SpoVK/Ycf46/Vps4 family AAA+-type ATPase